MGMFHDFQQWANANKIKARHFTILLGVSACCRGCACTLSEPATLPLGAHHTAMLPPAPQALLYVWGGSVTASLAYQASQLAISYRYARLLPACHAGW